MSTGERRYGGLPLRSTRVHKVRKWELVEEALDEEIEEALNERLIGRVRNSDLEVDADSSFVGLRPNR